MSVGTTRSPSRRSPCVADSSAANPRMASAPPAEGAAAWAVVPDDLTGGEADGAELQASCHQIGDPAALVGGRGAFMDGVRTEDCSPDRNVADERREVAQHRQALEHREVVGLGSG